jgi:predicted phage terminase large subunit-like protein
MDNKPSNFAKIYTQAAYTTPRHIRYLENELIGVYRGEVDKLVITMPPRHGKSELTSCYFPAWWLMNRPKDRIILVSYETSFASLWSGKAKEVYQRFVPNTLKVDRQQYWKTSVDGYMNAVGVGGSITGKGADLIIIDDPVKNDEQALSAHYREKTFRFYQSTLSTRLEPGGKIIVIQTRWNHDDLAGRLLAAGGWNHVDLKAIAGQGDALGRKEGEALWPERYDIDALQDIKKTVGDYWFSALYQQMPVSIEYQIFKPQYWKFFSSPPRGLCIQSWDTAFKDTEQNDYSVCTTWVLSENNFYLIDCFRKKIEFPDLERYCRTLYDKYQPSVVLIEDKASGISLKQSIERHTSIPVVATKPGSKDKVLRAHLASPHFENGRVFIQEKGWTHDVIEEMSQFPSGAHDDIVDSVMYALEYLSRGSSSFKASSKKKRADMFRGY